MKIIIVALMVLLAGCSSKPDVKVEIQKVNVPVFTGCINLSDIPVKQNYVTINIHKNDDPVLKVKKLNALRTQQEAYSNVLHKLLVGCTKVNK